MKKENLGAIILAAGKGKRLNSKKANKVTLPLGNKPMILHAMELLNKLKINPIIVVVGFAKESVKSILGKDIIFAEQKKRLGTGHAALCGVRKLPVNISSVLVLNGDDSAFYPEEVISKLIKAHLMSKAVLTFLTLNLDNPYGLGRILRDTSDKLVAIVEEKDATEQQRKIKEVCTGCYVFNVNFLRKNLRKIKKSSTTGEYYLVSLIEAAVKNCEKVETVKAGHILWRGVNTETELHEAQRLFVRKYS